MAPRELTPEEAHQRSVIVKWKGHHQTQIDRGMVVSVLKGSLTRVKNAFEEHRRLSIAEINAIEDETTKAEALEEFEEWIRYTTVFYCGVHYKRNTVEACLCTFSVRVPA